MSYAAKFVYALMAVIALDMLNYFLDAIAFWDIFKIIWRRM